MGQQFRAKIHRQIKRYYYKQIDKSESFKNLYYFLTGDLWFLLYQCFSILSISNFNGYLYIANVSIIGVSWSTSWLRQHLQHRLLKWCYSGSTSRRSNIRLLFFGNYFARFGTHHIFVIKSIADINIASTIEIGLIFHPWSCLSYTTEAFNDVLHALMNCFRQPSGILLVRGLLHPTSSMAFSADNKIKSVLATTISLFTTIKYECSDAIKAKIDNCALVFGHLWVVTVAINHSCSICKLGCFDHSELSKLANIIQKLSYFWPMLDNIYRHDIEFNSRTQC